MDGVGPAHVKGNMFFLFKVFIHVKVLWNILVDEDRFEPAIEALRGRSEGV